MKGLRGAVGFLTVVGGSSAPGTSAVAWFGVVGVLLGAVVGGVWWGAGELWAPLMAATLTVLADAVLTGGLHLDGLADSADGLLPPMEKERRLVVLSDPRSGAFGVTALVLVLGLRVAALAALEPDPLLLAGLWGASRAAMGIVLAKVPYAKGEGLASAFAGASVIPSVVSGLAALTLVPWAGVAGLLVGTGGVVWLARRRIGGFTGDVLGAAGLIGETCGLVLAAARW